MVRLTVRPYLRVKDKWTCQFSFSCLRSVDYVYDRLICLSLPFVYGTRIFLSLLHVDGKWIYLQLISCRCEWISLSSTSSPSQVDASHLIVMSIVSGSVFLHHHPHAQLKFQTSLILLGKQKYLFIFNYTLMTTLLTFVLSDNFF